jgi:hypothetical protein
MGFLLMLLLAFAFPLVASASETVDLDGEWWAKVPDDAKVYAVAVAMDSLEVAYLHGITDQLSLSKKWL